MLNTDNRGSLHHLYEAAVSGTLNRPAVVFSEAVTIPASAATGKARRFRAVLIEAGWSKNDRYWAPDVVKRDGPRAISEGALMAADHPSVSEKADRPEGSITRVLSRVASVPLWDPNVGAMGGLVADVEVFPHAEALLSERYAKSIGLSVRVAGTGAHGEVGGREGLIISEIHEGGTVDWVTHAGAGGRVIDLLESAVPAPFHEAHGMTANDLRRALQSAVDRAYDGTCCWAWVCDFHDDWVIYDLGGRDAPEEGRYRHPYTVDSSGTATLTGDAVQVNTQTAYVPVVTDVTVAESTPDVAAANPADPTPIAPAAVTAPVQETAPPAASAANTPTIKEAVVTTPEPTGAPPTGPASAGPTPPVGANPYTIEAVESLKRKAAQQEQDLVETRAQLETAGNDRVSRIKAEEALNASLTENARLRATETARSLTTAACTAAGLFECVHPWVASTVIGPEGAFIPLSEAREVDSPALKSRIDATVERWMDLTKKICEAAGADGRVRGLGTPATDEGMTEAQFEESLARRFASLPGMSEKTAAVAAKGR